MLKYGALTRLWAKNYKSIASCQIDLAPLTFLVGPNGAGKSNVVDVLRLTTDSLATSLDHAIRDRGGVEQVRRRSGGHPTHFSIRLEFTTPDDSAVTYAFTVGARRGGEFEVTEERLVVEEFLGQRHSFRVRGDRVDFSPGNAPPRSRDRLYLVTAASRAEFRQAFDFLSRMSFHNLNAERIRDAQAPDPGDRLSRSGDNAAAVLRKLAATGVKMESVQEYLRLIVPGLSHVEAVPIGPYETVQFHQDVAGSSRPWKFPAGSMSDGTARALGVLLALFQASPAPVIGVEEPEIALHPAATAVLYDALREASEERQVIVTSHDTDLLDHKDIRDSEIIAVRAPGGTTVAGPLDAFGRRALQQQLATAGELLKDDRLAPDASAAIEQGNLLTNFS